MGYPPPPAGPPPPYPFALGDDIADAGQNQDAQNAATTSAAKAAASPTGQAATRAAMQNAYDGAAALHQPAVNAALAAAAAAAANQGALASIGNGSGTKVASGSNGVVLPFQDIDVVSTAGFPQTGSLCIGTGYPTPGNVNVVTYTGISGNTFTGCSGGSETLFTGEPVVYNPLAAAAATQAANAAAAAAQNAQVAAGAAAAAAAQSAANAASGLSNLCKILEAGISGGIGGQGLGIAASTPTVDLGLAASAGIKASCCGFTLDLSISFAIDFHLPSFGFDLSLLLPYLGFSLSCDPSKPANLTIGVPYGGGRASNTEPDPDWNEDYP